MADLRNGLHGLAAPQAAVKGCKTVQEHALILSQSTTAQTVLEIEQEQGHARSKIVVSSSPC